MKVTHSLATLFLTVCLWVPLQAGAEDQGRTPLPSVPTAQGEQCVEDTTLMRKKHFDLLKHQRDETMHRGIRTKKHSLNECLSCHVDPASDPKKDGHFCKNCHEYAAVSIDCFQCHNTKPQAK